MSKKYETTALVFGAMTVASSALLSVSGFCMLGAVIYHSLFSAAVNLFYISMLSLVVSIVVWCFSLSRLKNEENRK
jgi:uncharacterized membrane protein